MIPIEVSCRVIVLVVSPNERFYEGKEAKSLEFFLRFTCVNIELNSGTPWYRIFGAHGRVWKSFGFQ